MNFFEAQDKARHNTALLVLLFVGALAGLVFLLYIAAHLFLRPETPLSAQTADYNLLLDVAVGTGALVSIGMLYKTLTLAAGGGSAVAESLGGKLIPPSTADPEERRLLNIVSEMSLASGCPTPQVYLIPDDNINAFAAGTKIGNAVIGVTRGAMHAFTRDEMQGVIAHEFSHIINGDMRLNLRLIGIIHGIMLLSYLGYFLLRSSFYTSFARGGRSNGAAAALPLAGLALLVAGSVGAFFGGLIRSAVSRQREYLADAAAVQYTRNPQSIGGALQKIGVRYGLLQHPKAAECAHMFFANGTALSFSNMFASHPPIEKRIKRVLPQWDGTLAIESDSAQADQVAAARQTADDSTAAFSSNSSHEAVAQFATSASSATSPAQREQPPDLLDILFGKPESADDIVGHAGEASDFSAAADVLQAMPRSLLAAISDPYSARALVYGFLLDKQDLHCRRAQCEHLRAHADTGVYELTMQLAPDIARLPRPACLPLLLQSMPALRTLSPRQFGMFANNVAALISADEKITVFEWSVEAALSHYLEECFGRPLQTAADAKPPVLPDTQTAAAYALSLVALAGQGKNAEDAFTRATAAYSQKLKFSNADFVPQQLDAAMRRLNKLPPAQKKIFLQTAANLAAHDNIITPDECALLRAFAALLDCPLPPAFA